MTMRLTALAACSAVIFALFCTLATGPVAAASDKGPGYYEALMHYCYKGGLADRIGRDPDMLSRTGVASKRAALKDLRGALGRGYAAVTALCATGYYRAIQAGYVTVIRETKSD